MKRGLIIGLVFAILIGATPAYASTGETITFEEYAAAIEAEYAKYGIEGGVYEPDGEFLCTYETLQSDLKIVEEYCKAYRSHQEKPSVVIPKIEVSMSPASMPGQVEMTTTTLYHDMSLPVFPVICQIQTTTLIDVDYQRSYIICANTPSLELLSGTGVDDWIEYVSHRTTDIDQNKKSLTMEVTCKVKKSLSLGMSTSWSKVTIKYIAYFNDVPC